MKTSLPSTPVGPLELELADDGALTEVAFVASTDAPEASGPVADAFHAYFAGDLHALETLPLRFERGTEFQRRVWEQLRGIGVGETISYAELARRVGSPNAFRAVGSANGENPIAIVVPCHRVIASGGGLGGYGGGLDAKAWLLDHEGARAGEPATLPGLTA